MVLSFMLLILFQNNIDMFDRNKTRIVLFSQRHIKSIQQFVQLKHAERRHILRNLSDEQYEDVMNVIGKMPHIDFQVRSEGEQQQLYL
jgi:preprotein translocase subunit Sec63